MPVGYSHVYVIDAIIRHPEVPAELSLTYSGSSPRAALFGLRESGTGYERIGGVPAAGVVSAELPFLPVKVFVADGVDYSEPPDRSCSEVNLLEWRVVPPSGLALFVAIDDCVGRPIYGLTAPGFRLVEELLAERTDVQPTLLTLAQPTVFATLLLDLSVPAEVVGREIEGATAFVNKLQVELGLPAQIGIEVFAGDASHAVWQAPTLDTALLVERLSAIEGYVPADPTSTNLYGAVIDGVNGLDLAMSTFRARNHGGALTAGYVVAFAGGPDTTGRLTLADVAATKAAHPAVEVLAVGWTTGSYDSTALAAVTSRGTSGAYRPLETPDPATLDRDFAALAARISTELRGLYLLGYCSVQRRGSPTVSIRTREGWTATPAELRFQSSTFEDGCDVAAFQEACQGPERCGGVGCGACDDRRAACGESSGTCLSYCVAADACGGQTIVNPLGYVELCTDAFESNSCGGATCSDLRSDPQNCGACGSPVPPGMICVGGHPVCPEGQLECDRTCVPIDGTNCGACGRTCADGTTCDGEACVYDPLGYVRIPAGTFTMGSPPGEAPLESSADETQHPVTLTHALWLKETEVTQGEWRAVMGTNPSQFAACGDECPVDQVSWDDAVTYLNALSQAEGLPPCYTMSPSGRWLSPGLLRCRGYRLPTEAEWEYAARAGTTGPFGDPTVLGTAGIGWCDASSPHPTAPLPVGSLAPNAWGLFDMHGNVWEWVHDGYQQYGSAPATDPIGPARATFGVVRGGGWDSLDDWCRAATRVQEDHSTRYEALGFRPAKSIPLPW